VSELERRGERSPVIPGGVDPHDEPSAEWGWHGSFPRTTRVAGVLSGIVLVVLLDSNEEGHVATIWTLALAIIIVLGVVLDYARKRHSWRR